ncbi:U3 small nucleolar RNA-associated protein 14 [Apiospora kogelbergensis]|uniref:U3 small nucleolar RNA-associated protein 14 n=1 Tax=Apiospora kogelbergensis TaxID=1337665 RepID=A0AAW0R177_9PEZI
MGGREAHGRPLMAAPAKGAGNKRPRSKAKSKTTAMNAFAIASDHHAERTKRTPRNRGLDVDFGPGKVQQNEDEDDEDEDDEDERPRKVRRATRDEDGKEIEYGSDSSGNEWRVGVTGNEEDDSEIESDEAFGESDEERFDGYAFGGSSQKKTGKKDEVDDDSDDESLGSDAIDLAAALDMSMSDDDGPEGEGSDDSDDESGSDESESSQDSSDEDEDDDVDGAGVKDFVSKFAGAAQDDEDDEPVTAQGKAKIDLKDLGLFGIKDPQLKQSVKLMNKEKKSSKPQKLDVPLARRAQGRLDRAVAYEQTNKTLDRWTETVKHNRRADHLMFPLAQNETGLAKLDNTQIQPIDQKKATNELEQTIMGIMEQSGLGPSAEKAKQGDGDDEEQQALSRQNVIDRRRERELKSREDKRAKRLKKIKSKTFHRIHRKQREKDDMREHEVRLAAGEIDSEEEREAQERQRATERMGARHRESKWAKMANKNGRAAWDEDVRTGIADMARRNDELRRRIDGRPDKGSDDDNDSDYSADSEEGDERKRIMQQLQDAENANDGPGSKLLNLPFMKKSEAAKKKANDELTKQILKQLRDEDGSGHDSDDSEPEGLVGRKTFGGPITDANGTAVAAMKNRKEKKQRQEEVAEQLGKILSEKNDAAAHVATSATREQVIKPTQGAWSAAPVEKVTKKQKKANKANAGADVLELDSSAVVRAPEAEAKSRQKPASNKQRTAVAGEDDASDDGESHMPIRFTEQELLDKAFGGLDVVADFEQEKHELQDEQDEKTIDKTMPGWGSWVGEGVSKREQKRHQGRFLEKQAGVKKTDRKDNKLKNVIISEKRTRKNDKYLASHLPHTYENETQYERSLRLPLGPDWVTKQTFQAATKPRVMIKQGIIAPMSRPEH